MLVVNNCVNDKYKDKLREQKLEFKVINKDDIVICLEKVLNVIKGDVEFRLREGVFKVLKE